MAVEEGRLAGTVAQYPDEMAVLAVEAMLKVLEGRPIAPEIDSPVVIITQDNLDTAGSQLGDPALPEYHFGALVKNLSNPFFLTMMEGYEKAAEDFGLNITIGSTPTEDAAEEQLAILEGWLNEGGFDGFAVTPFRATSLNTALARAAEEGIPVINLDELIPADAMEGLNIAQQIASNNVRAGSLAGQRVLELVPEGSQVAVVEGAPGTTSSIDRVTGFVDTVTAGGLKWSPANPRTGTGPKPTTWRRTSSRATRTSARSSPRMTAWASAWSRQLRPPGCRTRSWSSAWTRLRRRCRLWPMAAWAGPSPSSRTRWLTSPSKG